MPNDDSADKRRQDIGSKGGSAPHPNGRGLANASEATRKKVASQGGSSSHSGGREKNDEDDEK